jgi:GNAT superfamily N-acetyltransferase
MTQDSRKWVVRFTKDSEIPTATELVWRVFSEFEAPEYSQEGVDEFRRFLDGIPENAELRMIGFWDGDELIGLLGVRPPCHIALFFVDKKYHRKGIARCLWETMLADEGIIGGSGFVTVNSSPYAVEVYRRLGFVPTDVEQTVNGIRFTPMKYEIVRN